MSDRVGGLRVPPEQSTVVPGIAVLFAVTAMAVLGAALTAAFLWPSGVAPDTRVHAGRVDDFVVDEPVLFEQEQFFLVRLPDDSFIALYVINPHNLPDECPVRWEPERDRFDPASGRTVIGVFHAPCHGEMFDITGRRLFGPSPRDLDRFPVVVDGSRVYVDAGKHQLIRAD